mmetsp:Transcript_113416/g.352262  ORF Transcript_113416/g.352262 Transcript_113416/m.352262 type:complete len:277 (+) Transcript_113416:386-1216(+)
MGKALRDPLLGARPGQQIGRGELRVGHRAVRSGQVGGPSMPCPQVAHERRAGGQRAHGRQERLRGLLVDGRRLLEGPVLRAGQEPQRPVEGRLVLDQVVHRDARGVRPLVAARKPGVGVQVLVAGRAGEAEVPAGRVASVVPGAPDLVQHRGDGGHVHERRPLGVVQLRAGAAASPEGVAPRPPAAFPLGVLADDLRHHRRAPGSERDQHVLRERAPDGDDAMLVEGRSGRGGRRIGVDRRQRLQAAGAPKLFDERSRNAGQHIHEQQPTTFAGAR